MKPSVSAYCAAYNHEQFIDEAVASVLGQTMDDLELVVVDNGSIDGTWQRLRQLEKEDGRLRVFQHPGGVNKGRQASLRLAIESSRGRYLARIDSDDRWAADKLERQLPDLEGGAILSYGQVQCIDAEGRPIPSTERVWGTEFHDTGGVWGAGPYEWKMAPLEALLRRDYIPAGTVVISRSAYDRVGGFDRSQTWEDYALWLRLVALASPAFVDAVLADYRVHGTNEYPTILAAGRDLHLDLSAVESLSRLPLLPIEHRAAVDSWVRCHRALVSLADGKDQPGQDSLRPEDAPRLALRFSDLLPRLVQLTGRRRVLRWRERILDLGPSFEAELGLIFERPLYRKLRAAFRRRQLFDSARSAATLLALLASQRHGRKLLRTKVRRSLIPARNEASVPRSK